MWPLVCRVASLLAMTGERLRVCSLSCALPKMMQESLRLSARLCEEGFSPTWQSIVLGFVLLA